MTYRAEPVPEGLDFDIAEYLDRQFMGIDNHLSRFIAPIVGQEPFRLEMGAIVYVREEGFFGCVENENGDLEWKKLQLS